MTPVVTSLDSDPCGDMSRPLLCARPPFPIAGWTSLPGYLKRRFNSICPSGMNYLTYCTSFYSPRVLLIASSHSPHPESWCRLPSPQPPESWDPVTDTHPAPPFPLPSWFRPSAILSETPANGLRPSPSLSFVLQREWSYDVLLRWLFIFLRTKSSLLSMTYTRYTGVKIV